MSIVDMPRRPIGTHSTGSVARVCAALAELASGATVVVFDDRDDQADLVLAAEHATTAELEFMIRHTGGFVQVALTHSDCVRLQLPPMWGLNDANVQSGPTVTVDAAAGIGTGISAADRALTIRTVADPTTRPDDLTRPGHVAPVKATGAATTDPGVVDAVVHLMGAAGLRTVAALSTLVSPQDETRMATREESRAFAAEHGLAFVTTNDAVVHAGAAATRPA
ncbi:3,4-dihydroxy-2-butanone-4-phosphate synthase [Gordonia sp. CPCC 206044]|uniref:3,4-dihydroxy-2-butanone-4-phosphate synthase n=1 Tax=Gordonia sp. CPCC 206044 TaxID=3140793 RepID=UPI003AF4024F